jgi:hypothetical protein
MTDVLDCYAHLKMGTYYESYIASGDVELRLLIERRELQLAYSLWRSMPGRRRGDGNWNECRRISDQVVTREDFLELQRISSKFDLEGSFNELLRNLKSEGLGKQPSHDASSFSPDQFNVHFSSVAAGVRSQVVFNRQDIFEGFAFRCVEKDEVFAASMSIGSGAVGANGFSLKFIKIVLPHILSVLTHLFNFSITTFTFPLPKCGSPTGLSDFRPKSILPVLSKGFERLICDQFLVYLDSGGLLSPYQSGFCKFRSTATVLIKIMDHIHLGVERSGFLISVLLDFSNAFDFMSNNLLLHKLRFKFGLSSTACWLFGSFVGPRTQKVMINEDRSDSVDINIGSP